MALLQNSLQKFKWIYAAAFLAIFIIYFKTLSFGFDYDDYHLVRPYSFGEVLASFTGDWDSTNIERDFYRPLTVVFFALRFVLFGYHATPYHVLSLVLFFAVAILVHRLLWRYSQDSRLAALGIFAVIVYPYMAHAAVAWVTNQMHLLQMICFLSAWLFLAGIKEGEEFKLFFLWPFQIAAFLIKEDGILLLPALFLILAVQKIILRQPIGRWKTQSLFWISSVLLLFALYSWRNFALQTMGGYQTFELFNIPLTLKYILFLSQAVVWDSTLAGIIGQVTRLFAAGLLATGFVSIILLKSPRQRVHLFLFIAGGIVLVSFNMLVVFSTKIYQWHLQSLGHALMLGVAMSALIAITRQFFQKKIKHALGWAAVVLPLILMAISAFLLANKFAPFSFQTVQHDKRVSSWDIDLPQEHRDTLLKKMQNPLYKRFEQENESGQPQQ